jgi:poly(hydroxyalkanoate) depolymerase family esterase
MLQRAFFMLMAVCICACDDSDDLPGMESVEDFGSNPGNLLMFRHVSATATADAPLVVVLHGCSQNAADAAELSGWNELSDRFGFHVLYPEQKTINNISECFNWFDEDDIVRNSGEARSIEAMVWKMRQDYSIDAQRIYVTGLSAGGAMSAVMLGCYPDIFNAAAIMSGGPYFAATDMFGSASAMLGNVTKSPQEWGNLVRAHGTGPWGRVAIFHGENDDVVNPTNARELVKQWTDVHGIDQDPDYTVSYPTAPDVTRIEYHNVLGQAPVVWFRITDMGHALAVDPGVCRNQGGQTGTFGTDKGFFSTYTAALFFDLIPPYMVIGPVLASAADTVIYSVASFAESQYAWQVPTGSQIIGIANGSQIQLVMGSESGVITATETDVNGCSYMFGPLDVSVQ